MLETLLTSQINKLPRGTRQTDPNAPCDFGHPSFVRGRIDLLDGVRRKMTDSTLELAEKPKLRPNVRRSSDAGAPMPPPSMSRRSSGQSAPPQPQLPPMPVDEATRTAASRAAATARARAQSTGSPTVEQQLRGLQDACDFLYRMVIQEKSRGDLLTGHVMHMQRAMQAAGVPGALMRRYSSLTRQSTWRCRRRASPTNSARSAPRS